MIAIAGGKGGCGKTTTAACLARELAVAGSNPIVVDGDVDMPNLHVLAGARLGPGLDVLATGASIDEGVQSALELPGVRVVSGGEEPIENLQCILERLRTLPGPVLVDTPAGASPAVADSLRVADEVLVVSTPTRRSLEDAAKSAAMARALDTLVLGAVITRSTGEIDPHSLLNCPVISHVPLADDPLADDGVRNAYVTIEMKISKRNV